MHDGSEDSTSCRAQAAHTGRHRGAGNRTTETMTLVGGMTVEVKICNNYHHYLHIKYLNWLTLSDSKFWIQNSLEHGKQYMLHLLFSGTTDKNNFYR